MMRKTAITVCLMSLLMMFLVTGCSDSGGVASTPTPPAQVGLLTVTPADSQLTVTWDAVPGATGYEVYYSTGNDSSSATRYAGDSNAADTSCVITGLTNGTAYYVWAKAVNAAGTSGFTAANAPATPLAPPAAPTLLTVTPGDGRLTVTWTAVGGATGYDVFFGTANDSSAATRFTGDSDPSDTTCVVTGLQNNTPYYVWVKALRGATSSSFSVASAPTTPALPVPNTALFKNPQGIASDGTNLYVADSGNNTIRKIVIATGATSTLAGTAGLSGADNGTGAAARFRFPLGLIVLGPYLYVADTNNNQIRRIALATGEVTTLTGISDGYPGTVDGDAATTRLGGPTGITTDGTYLYVTDQLTNKVRRVTTSGVTTTIAGSASFSRPMGITTDGSNLYVADADNYLIRKIVIATEAVSTLAGSGASGSADNPDGLLASFSQVFGVACDGSNLYLADTLNHTVRQVAISTGATSTLAGNVGVSGASNGTGTAASFFGPKGITRVGGDLYLAEFGNSTIRKIVIATGATTTVAGSAGVTGSAD